MPADVLSVITNFPPKGTRKDLFNYILFKPAVTAKTKMPGKVVA